MLPLDFCSPMVFKLFIVLGKAKRFHILLDIVPRALGQKKTKLTTTIILLLL